MKIKELVRPQKNTPMNAFTLNGNLNISELNPDTLNRKESMITILDENSSSIGEIDSRDLIYLVKQNRNKIFEDMLDYIEEGIVAIDASGRIYYLNKAYSYILGIPLYKIIGKYIQKIESGALLNKVLRNKRPISKQKQLIASVNKYVSLQIIPQFYRGDFIGAVSIFKDITELNTMNQEVQRMTGVIAEVAQKLDYHEAFKNLGIITQNSKFINVLEVANIAAKTDVTVLIRGESGVGKEVLAKLLHSGSNRKNNPLITVNCAAIPENLFESELFGYEEGAFTGANKGGKIGKFQLADKGTIFLDEIGDLPLSMQAKLLRVLQQGEIEKIGSSHALSVDVRVIAATNKPLEELMKENKFREDLFFRLNVISLNIPPLRERKDDIPLLANHFFEIYKERYKSKLMITSKEYEDMMSYDWPGNIRQLQNCIERVAILGIEALYQTISDGLKSLITEKSIISETFYFSDKPLKDALKDYEKLLIQETLKQQNGNKEKTIKVLGLSKRTFYRRCKELKIMP